MTSDTWKIVPYVGVGPLLFGIDRRRARSLVEGVPKSFRQNPYAHSDTDAYKKLNVNLYYDNNEKLMCIMSYGSNPIHYMHIRLLNRPLEEVLEELAHLGGTSRYEDEGYWIDALGFVVYAEDTTVKAITAYRKGYYEEEVALRESVKRQRGQDGMAQG